MDFGVCFVRKWARSWDTVWILGFGSMQRMLHTGVGISLSFCGAMRFWVESQ